MIKYAVALLPVLAVSLCSTPPSPPPPDKAWTLKGDALTMLMDSDRGAAIYSIKLGGYEYVVSTSGGSDMQNGNYVHGNLVQTAWFQNNQPLLDNPTEAGAITGQNSTLINAAVAGKVFTSSVHPAYFAGSTSGAIVSPHTLSKRVEVDWSGITNAVRHDMTVTMGEPIQLVTNLNLSWYASPGLSALYVLKAGTWTPTPYTGAPTYIDPNAIKSCSGGEPMIMATPDGAHAVGVYTPKGVYNMMALNTASGAAAMDLTVDGEKTDGNCMWIISPAPNGSSYSFSVFYVLGTRSEVEAKMKQIMTTVPPA